MAAKGLLPKAPKMTVYKTLLFQVITTAVLIIGVFFFLNFFTNHDDELIPVPKLEGVRVDKAIQMLEEADFEYEITDTVYRDGQPLLSIVVQNPVAGFEVKKGRKIYLVLNSDVIPDVEMPDLAGKTSYKQAVRLLENRGLNIGRKIKMPDPHVKDPDSEPVLRQYLAGDTIDIAPGRKIKRHTRIDLVVGSMILDEMADSTLNINPEG